MHVVVQGFSGGKPVWSPDNRHLALVNDGVAVLDTLDGAIKGRFPDCAEDAAFSSDGSKLVVLGCQLEASRATAIAIDQPPVAVWIWDLKDDTTREVGRGRFQSVEVDADGRGTLLGMGEVALLDLEQERVLTSYVGKPFQGGPALVLPPGDPRFVAGPKLTFYELLIDANGAESAQVGSLSPDATVLFDGRGVGAVGSTPSALRELASCTQTSEAWAPNSQKVAVRCSDGTGQRTNLLIDRTGKRVCELPAGYGDLQWSRDSARIVLNDSDDNQRHSKLSVLSGSDCKALHSMQAEASGFVLTPDLSRAAAFSGGELVLLQLSEGSTIAVPSRPAPLLYGSAADERDKREQQQRALDQQKQLRHLKDAGESLLFSPQGKYVLHNSKSLDAYELKTGNKLFSLTKKDAELVWPPQWSPDEKVVAVSGKGLIDLSGKLVWQAAHFVRGGFSPNSQVVLSYSDGFRDSCTGEEVGTIQARSVATGALLAELPKAVYALAWSSDGANLLTTDGCGGSLVQRWDTQTWTLRASHHLRAGNYWETIDVEVAQRALGMSVRKPAPFDAFSRLFPAELASDGKRLLLQSDDSYSQLRLRDGAVLRQYLSPDGGALQLDQQGHFDATSPAALELAQVRVGANVLSGKLAPLSEMKPNALCPGLLQAFLHDTAPSCRP